MFTKKINESIKIKLDNFFEILENLRRLGAANTGSAMVKIIRFDTPAKDLEKQGKYIRLMSGFSNELSLKEEFENNLKYRTRQNTNIEIDDIEKMNEVLMCLGYTYTRELEKFSVEWIYKNSTITIDELPFGIYINIEGEENNIDEICSDLHLKKADIICDTYWEEFEKISQEKDILFKKNHNFKLI